MSNSALDRSDTASARRRHWRMFKDQIARYCMSIGGIGVIIAIVLIFFYLVVVVLPLFGGANIEHSATYSVPGSQADTLFLATEEQTEIGLRVADDGEAVFFNTQTGTVFHRQMLPIPHGVTITSFAEGDLASGLLAFGLSNGSTLLVQHAYSTTYPGGKRKITPSLAFPLSDRPIAISAVSDPLIKISAQLLDEQISVVAISESGRVLLVSFQKEESLFSDDENAEWTRTESVIGINGQDVSQVLLDQLQSIAYFVTNAGEVAFFNTRDKSAPELVQKIAVVTNGERVETASFLNGSISLLIGTTSGRIAQWFPVRDADNQYTFRPIRDFQLARDSVSSITAEQRRKGFLAGDDQGNIGLFHSTAHRTVLTEQVTEHPILKTALSPRANAMLIEDTSGQLHFWRIDNEHPEVSWSSLWGKVWYESYPEPDYIWQSSSASNDFEPKFSLMPLSFGTLKAAFYAMLFAIPLSLMAAIYTAYFMTPAMRKFVKPSVEIMEALPTVILGFLAGLWLAPLIESNLPGIFSLLLLMPLGILAAAYAWEKLPENIHHRIPDGWQGALMIPVVMFIGWLALAMSLPMENLFFNGDMKQWMSTELDIGFDQRNSIVVGMAMGFAVIPTIFSITEDAIFSVPKALTNGSLALGATPWQSLTRVVLLTASPGIFSAIMIGMGRAVGETMIVLMATGNTPVMDLSVFQGMRTLSANVAVEMPESELNSTHYRILFLAALVLFLFTFAFNTIAELVRQRLRERYSSI